MQIMKSVGHARHHLKFWTCFIACISSHQIHCDCSSENGNTDTESWLHLVVWDVRLSLVSRVVVSVKARVQGTWPFLRWLWTEHNMLSRGSTSPQCHKISMNSKSAFKILANQMTCKCCLMFVVQMIIVLTHTESPMGLIQKSD